MAEAHAVTLMKFAMLPLGVATRQEYEKFVAVYAGILHVNVIGGMFAIVKVYGDADASSLEIVYTLNCACSILVMFWLGRLQRARILGLYGEIRAIAAESEECAVWLNRVTRKLDHYLLTVGCASVFVLAGPYCAVVFTGVQPSNVKALVYPSWYPWSRDHMVVYTLTIALQVACVLIGYYLLLSCLVVFFSIVAIAFVRVRIIKSRIRSLDRRIRRSIVGGVSHSPMKSEQVDRQMYVEFVAVIQRHQYLIKYLVLLFLLPELRIGV